MRKACKYCFQLFSNDRRKFCSDSCQKKFPQFTLNRWELQLILQEIGGRIFSKRQQLIKEFDHSEQLRLEFGTPENYLTWHGIQGKTSELYQKSDVIMAAIQIMTFR